MNEGGACEGAQIEKCTKKDRALQPLFSIKEKQVRFSATYHEFQLISSDFHLTSIYFEASL